MAGQWITTEMQATPSLDFIPPKPKELWGFATMLQKSWRNLTTLINSHLGFGDGVKADNIDGVWANVVAPAAPNTDFTITHNLGRLPVGYWILYKDRAVDVYTGSVAATKTQITLRATVASAVLRLFIIGLLFALLGAGAQAQTTVNLTVQDTNSTLWTGPWTVSILPPSGIVPPPVPVLLSGGGSLATQSGTLSAGTATISIPANSNIAPQNTHWLFNVCFNAGGPCFSQLVTISVSSPVSLTLTPPAPILGVGAGSSLVAGPGSLISGTFTCLPNNISTTLDASCFSGADDSIRLQNCQIAAKAINPQAGICDGRKLTNLQLSQNYYAAASLVPTTGRVLLPGGKLIALYGPNVPPNGWSTEGLVDGAGTGKGTVIAAGPLFACATGTVCTTGTVTMGTPGANEVITGSGTNWHDNFVTHSGFDPAAGCAFFSPGTQPTPANSTYGFIAQGGITATGSLTLAWGANNGTGAPGGSAYVIDCSPHPSGDGSPSGAQFGQSILKVTGDCSNIATCVPWQNFFGQQGDYLEGVSAINYSGIGIQWESSGVQNSGVSKRVLSNPGSGGTAASIPLVVANNGTTQFGWEGVSISKGGGSTPTCGIFVNGGNNHLIHLDLETVTNGVCVGTNTSCPVATPCARPPLGANGTEIDGVSGTATTGVLLSNALDINVDTIIRSIQTSGGTNNIVDQRNGCTILSAAESRTGKYELDHAGNILSSSSLVNSCRGKTPQNGTCTMVAGTCTYTYTGTGSYVAAPNCQATWNGTGALTGFVKCVPGLSSAVVTSSVAGDTAVMLVQITGAPN